MYLSSLLGLSINTDDVMIRFRFTSVCMEVLFSAMEQLLLRIRLSVTYKKSILSIQHSILLLLLLLFNCSHSSRWWRHAHTLYIMYTKAYFNHVLLTSSFFFMKIKHIFWTFFIIVMKEKSYSHYSHTDLRKVIEKNPINLHWTIYVNSSHMYVLNVRDLEVGLIWNSKQPPSNYP